jgi:hypothetical protein
MTLVSSSYGGSFMALLIEIMRDRTYPLRFHPKRDLIQSQKTPNTESKEALLIEITRDRTYPLRFYSSLPAAIRST